jgi:hypothetical protein
MNKLVLFILGLFLLSSCNQIIDYNIPEDQLPIYNTNDTVFFKDNINNHIDTFLIDLLEYHRASDYSSYQHIDVYYNLLKGIVKHEFMYTDQSNGGISVSIHNSSFSSSTYSVNTISNYILNGTNYSSVKIAYEKYIPDTIPNTIYFGYKYCILRYEYKDGRIYELMKK